MAQDLSEKVLETITITRQLRLLLLLLKILDKEFHHNEAQESYNNKRKRNESKGTKFYTEVQSSRGISLHSKLKKMKFDPNT